MRQVIMIGCDLHDKTMLLKIATGCQAPETRSVRNTAAGRWKLIADLQSRAAASGGARVLFAYEASGQGFGLYDELTEAGIECHVLAPTRIARSQRGASQKTDEKDAQQLLELLRAHVLAGNELPTVWIPDPTTRDDRELVRMRLDVAEKMTMTKSQIQSLLKRCHIRREEGRGKGWTRLFRSWLKHSLCESADSPLGMNARLALGSLLRQLDSLEEEEHRLDDDVNVLSAAPRYAAAVQEMTSLCGVGVLTALVFLTELGDLTRFANRRQLAAYLGLAPRSHESGEVQDRKGAYHPPRVQPGPQNALPGHLGARSLGLPGTRDVRPPGGQESQEEKDRRGGLDAPPGGADVAPRASAARPVARNDPRGRGGPLRQAMLNN
jgi:transposase